MLDLNDKRYNFKLVSRKKGVLRFEVIVSGPSDVTIFDISNILYESSKVLYNGKQHYVLDYGTTYKFMSKSYVFWIEIDGG